MTFLAPAWILLAAAASAAIVAIHLIAWQLPRAVPLPTTRFVPDEPARSAARTIRLSDLALLALRVMIVMAGGLALASPVVRSDPKGTATVVAVERGAGGTVLRDSVRGIPRGDRVAFVVFDTGARLFTDEEAASGAAAGTGTAPASLTVGLLAAIREARRLARDHESVSIAVVSTFARSSFDVATEGVRDVWPDSIRVVRLPPASDAVATARVEVTGSDDDPVVAGIRLAESNRTLRGTSRVIRSAASAADSALADGGVAVVLWPRAVRADSGRVDGVHAGEATAVSHFTRSTLADSGRVVARWADGNPAAREVAHGSGCIRTIGFDVPDAGDFVLTPAFQRLAAALLAPCGGVLPTGVAADSLITRIANPREQAALVMPDERGAPNRLATILMGLAVLLGLAELALRRRGAGARRGLEAAA
jgi:hypothetical protein